jgi:vitamin B12 transporter
MPHAVRPAGRPSSPSIRLSCARILAPILFFIPLFTAAATDAAADTAYQLEPVVVTATRSETARENVSANVSVITRRDIENLPVTSVADALQYVPGVYMEFNGGPGSLATDIRIQGCDPRHVAVFQDGVPLNQLANPVTDLAYLPIDAVERIEVYKGAASSAWGSALGGVINIVTQTPNTQKPFSGDVSASYGEFDTIKSKGTVSGTVNRFGYLMSATHEESDGFIRHSGYDRNSVYAKLRYDLGETGRIGFAFFNDDGDNADPLPTRPAYWNDIDRNRTYETLTFETRLTDAWEAAVEGRHHRWNVLIDQVYADHRQVSTDYTDETWGLNSRLTYRPNERHSLTMGADGNFGEYDLHRAAGRYDTDTRGVYINDTLRLWVFTLNTGLRYDDDDTFGSAVSPLLGIVWHGPKEAVLVRFQAARGFSAPPAAYVFDPVYGNRDLDSETAVNYQLGGTIRPLSGLSFDWNFFRSEVDDLINFNFDTFKFENIDEVLRQGVEGTVTAAVPFGVTLSFSGSYVDVRNNLTDEVIENIPRTIYTIKVSHVFKRLTHTLAGSYIDHNSAYPETEDRRFVFNYRFNIDLPFKSGFGTPSLFGAVYNLGDSDYLYRAAWPQPRRWVEAGLRFRY